MSNKNSGGLFELKLYSGSSLTRRAWETVRPSVEWGIGFSELARIYARVTQESDAERFVARTLDVMQVTWSANERDLARIPRSGPCIVVANHPFGGIDGIVLLSILLGVRKDVKLLVNQLLSRIPELSSATLPVDVFGAPDAARTNGLALREALRHLKGGGLLALFPAGEVAHFDAMRGRLVEKEWHPSVARLASRSEAPVVPIYFRGGNSALFHVVGLVHPVLRTLLLPRELLNKRGRAIDVQVGGPIHPRSLARFEDDTKRAQYLKQRTLMLSGRLMPRQNPHELRFGRAPGFAPRRALEPILPAVEPGRLEQELHSLPPEQVLIEDGERVVCWARAAQIPGILREIGRLRELTFREVSEGTGKSIDLDEFDAEYLHLFSFDRRERALIGAYRMGLTDELLGGSHRGAEGLYTSTLFSMAPALFQEIGPAIEMGRSFVCARYQRSASGLYSLWRGIGRFLVERPRYRFLFGPVSISAAYRETSRAMMVDFVREGGHMHPLSRHVRQRHAFVPRARVSAESGLPPQVQQLLDVDELSEMVADIEPDRRGVPVLLKQYLKLGGAILGFNVDPEFSGVLDLLVLVDLTKTAPKILAKYLGTDAARDFLAHHQTA